MTTLPTFTATISASADTVAAAQVHPPADLLTRGVLVGRYIVLDCVGSGGMGRVYAAYDPELGRKVALKLLHDEGTDKERQARILREAQAMASLSHPNICPVHDVGSFHARVFFAMEYVDGVSLRAWLEGPARGWREILAMFLAMGRGITEAHTKGLVHSDLKPENVMLGADGRPRVMDFGIARVEGASRAETSLAAPSDFALAAGVTETTTIRGTPQYMAPEQWSGGPIDARCDQFSFCVMLWEALNGERPFPDDYIAGQVASGQELRPRAPAHPSRMPSWLRALLLRGLSARPYDRFATMDALLAALASGQARRRSALLSAGVTALALTVGGVMGWRSWEHARHVVACEAAGASLVAEVGDRGTPERLQAVLAAADVPEAGEAAARIAAWTDDFVTRWGEVRSATCIARDARPLACLYDQRQRLVGLLDALADEEPRVRARAIRVAAALPDPRMCADPVLVTPAGTADGISARSLATALQQELRRIETFGATGHAHEARERALSVLARASAAGLGTVQAEAMSVAGLLADWDADYAEAERLSRRALVEAGALGRDDVAADAALRLILIVGLRQARPTEALMLGDVAEMLVRRLGQTERFRGARLLGYLAVAHQSLGALSEAQALSERGIAILQRELGRAHPELSLATTQLAHILSAQGKHREALAMHGASLTNSVELFGRSSIEVGMCETNMGLMHSYVGEHAQAQALQEHALVLYERLLGPEAPDTARVRNNLAVALAAVGRREEARSQYERAYRAIETTLGPNHPEVAGILLGLASLQQDLGEHTMAEQNLRRALSIGEAAHGTDHPQLMLALNGLGGLALVAGRFDEAIGLLERSIELGVTRDALPELVADARAELARAVWAARADRATALALAEQAAAVFREVGGRRVPALASLEEWMRTLAAR